MARTTQKSTRIYVSGSRRQERPTNVDDLIIYTENHRHQGSICVVIIENISLAMFDELRGAWSLDEKMIHDHFANPGIDCMWTKLEDRLDEPGDPKYRHLDGIHEYHNIDWSVNRLLAASPNHCERHVFQVDTHSPNSNTRVTYCRPLPHIYLFLVDAPLSVEEEAFPKLSFTPHLPSLRFPYSRNYGGILLPGIQRDELVCNLFNACCSVFDHDWQVKLLFEPRELFPAPALLYLLSSSIWETKFRYLDSEMRRISFGEIRNPDLQIGNSLHDLRASLASLRTMVKETITYVPPHVKDFLISISNTSNTLEPIIERLEGLEKRASDLQTFFTETIQLLAITISIRDSQASITQSKESLKQTKQGIYLTRLAALYLPLSVATGLFGMNLGEINGAKPKWWAFIIVLIGLCLATLGLFWAGAEPNESRRQQKEKRSNVHNDTEKV